VHYQRQRIIDIDRCFVVETRRRRRCCCAELEHAVYLHTKEPADICGLTDRGALEVGLKADINVIDMEKLRIQHPYVAYELPTGAKIWTQDVIGYDYTIINGVITFKDNVKTGALPGGLVRNPRTQHVRDAGAVSEVDLDFVMAQRGPVRPHEQERNATQQRPPLLRSSEFSIKTGPGLPQLWKPDIRE
jgi:hypothetical protein